LRKNNIWERDFISNNNVNTAVNMLRQEITDNEAPDKAQAIADDFVAYLNEFHTYD